MLALNNLLALLVELAALAACARWGWSRFEGLVPAALAALACAGIFVLLWAIYAAPKSKHRLAPPGLLAFKIAIFTGATAALGATGSAAAAILFALAAASQLALAGRHGVL